MPAIAGPVLLDNTALTNFAQVERTDLLEQMWETVGTTIEVRQEYLRGVALGRTPAGAWDALTIFERTDLEHAEATERLSRLGAGERTCLVVVLHRRGLLVTDDRLARKIAIRLGVQVTGTLGVLALCVVKNDLTLAEADALLQAMIGFGYRSPVTSLATLLPK